MLFRLIFPKALLLRLSSSASGGVQPPIQALSVLVARLFTTSSSSDNAVSGSSADNFYSRLYVRVSVWWDFDSCNLPEGANVFEVDQAITAAIRSTGIRGPITVTAFGDLCKLSRITQSALSSTGIHLKYVPRGLKTSKDLIRWVSQNPPPAHLFLISSDRVFARALHKLRRKDYNILLASKTYEPDNLFKAATIMWDWCSLVKRKSVTGIHFEQWNRGPLAPWIPLQDSYAAVEISNSVKTEESPASNSNFRTDYSGYGPSTPSDQRVGGKVTDKSKSRGFFNWILKWFKFWGKDATAAKLCDEPR